MTVSEVVSVVSAAVSTSTLIYLGGKAVGTVNTRLEALTEQVKKTNGTVTDINTHGCVVRREAIAREEAKEQARAIERRVS